MQKTNSQQLCRGCEDSNLLTDEVPGRHVDGLDALDWVDMRDGAIRGHCGCRLLSTEEPVVRHVVSCTNISSFHGG